MIKRTQEEIMKNWPTEWVIPLVSIRCTAYNHELYIAQALDGFLTQKTDFPFEVIIHDDASTDKTADIIRKYEEKYPKIIRPIYETENQYSKHDGSLNKIINKASGGKYIAICEGDDFWIDPYKLQKQVDFLENNPEFGMCYTNFNVHTQKNNKTQFACFINQPQKYPSEYTLENWIIKAGYVAPMTWVLKKSLWEEACTNAIKSPDGTYVLFAYFLAHSKVYCLKEDTTATYRILQESAVHTKSLEKSYARIKALHQVKLTLAKLYLNGSVYEKAFNQINKDYYRICLKLIVAMNDSDEISSSMKWVKKSFSSSILYFISQKKPLNDIYSFLYKSYKRF